MANDEYFVIDKKMNLEVRDVTLTLGQTMAGLLLSDPNVAKLTFPRLRFPSFESLGYFANDYKEIARRIVKKADQTKGIRVYETKGDTVFRARYQSAGDRNFFILTPEITKSLTANMATVVHETTHAIQDLKEWRESSWDREIDAHFAEAVYSLLAGQSNKKTILNHVSIAAECFIANPKYLQTLAFRQLREKMRGDIYQHYQFMLGKIDPDFDSDNFNKEFSKRQRLDGIPV